MLTRKDLLTINATFSNGKVLNGSSLDFVVEQTHRSRNWYTAMCLIVRAILVDHVFEDGNKRTAANIIMSYLEMNSIPYNPDMVGKAVLRIVKENITDTRQIGRLINHATH